MATNIFTRANDDGAIHLRQAQQKPHRVIYDLRYSIYAQVGANRVNRKSYIVNEETA
jgi:hypothetical protein